MDSDRKSAVSSFYGGRRSSVDALNAEYQPPPRFDSPGPVPPGVGRPRVDSSSSFYADRQSRPGFERVDGSAGYNRMSFFDVGRTEPLKGGRDEEEPEDAVANDIWDVYADFNNAGPRYSTAFGMGHNETGYQQLPTPSVKSPEVHSIHGPVELVTVPAMGAEWSAAELKGMKKSSKRRIEPEVVKDRWRAWNRGQIGICGNFGTRRHVVYSVFALCVALAIILAICIPRVPSFAFTNSNLPLLNATGSFYDSIPIEFNSYPANFSFPAFANITLDTSSTIVPITFSKISATVYDTNTNMQVGTGNYGHLTVPAKAYPIIQFPLNFTYIAENDTDPTWNDWFDACKNSGTYATGVRPGVSFIISISFDIIGLISSNSATLQASDAACPFQLPLDAY